MELTQVLTLYCYSGNEIGPFRAVEESTIAHLTASADRSDIYAWYSLIGTAGTALGFAGCGWIITYLRDGKQYNSIKAYRIIYLIYAVVGIVKLCLALLLSRECEVDTQPKSANATETEPLLGNGTPKSDKKKRFSLLPNISKESRIVLVQLCILFAFDNFASGLAPL